MNSHKSILNAKNLALLLFYAFFTFKLSAKQIPTVNGIMKTTSYIINPVVVGTPFASNMILVSPLANAKDYSIQNTIFLKYDLNTDTFFLNKTTLSVKVMVNRWDASNNPLPSSAKRLTISIDNKLNRLTLEQSILKLTNGYKVSVKIDSIWLNGVTVKTLPKWASVESEINMDRYFDFTSATNTSANLTGITALDNDCDLINDEVLVNWAIPSSVPEEYQLEWAFVNSYSSIGGTYPASAFFADFKNNSTRVTTQDNSYKITLLFDRGYLAFRVRAVGRDWLNPTKFIYGPWSSADYVNMGTLSGSQLYTISQEHEKIKNWQYSSTYAEEGKKKEVINYFDGSLHNRQTVTKINSDKNVIVGETIYDYQGRPAVNVLPVPIVLNCSTAVEPTIKYYTKFNVDNLNNAYSKIDFDLDTTTCSSVPHLMDTLSGASRYYSNNNPDKSRQQAFLPHAKKFPFTQIEYTPDNTGRIRNQSGVGKDYQLGSGKETKYLYGQPNQLQVDRLFGSETGDASHYKKNVVIDANGQSSVTYMNQEGKTIATALAGTPPTEGTSTITRMDSLDYANKNQAKFTIDLFNKNSLGQSILNAIPPSNDQIDFSTQLLVPFKSLYEFNYNLTVDTVHDACLRPNICFQCVYDLEVLVKDECGVALNSTNKTIGKFIPGTPIVFTTTCSTGSSIYTDAEAFNLILQPGVYTVSKILKINKSAKDFYVKAFLDSVNNKCFKTLSQFQAAELAKIDTSDCYNSCASCAAALGPKDDYVSAGTGTAAQWDFLYDQCVDPCRYKSLCQVTYDMLLSDVSPGGQYGKYNSLNYSASSEPLSVFNSGNALNPNLISSDGNWHFPRVRLNGNVYQQYLDENGDRTKVIVTPTVGGNFLPPLVNNALVYVDPNTLQKFSYPENLVNLSDFIPLWDPGFAKALVMYHPEYAYYVSCSEHAITFSGDNKSSDGLDSLLLATETFSDAVTNKFINSSYSGFAPPINKINHIWNTVSNAFPYDPFFTNNVYQYSGSSTPFSGTQTNLNMTGGAPYSINIQAEMTNIINNYKFIGLTPYTMADVAAIVARCGNNFGSTPTASCLAFGQNAYPIGNPLNDSIRNQEWRLFKQFYFAEKQKLQFKRMNFYAQHSSDAYSNYYGGCNACFGTGSYNPFASGMIYPPTFSSPTSAYFDFSQPCSYATNSNYSGVTKRFYDPANTGLNTGSVGPLIYQTTGQCPLAFQLQGFLNGMTSSSKLTIPTLNLNTVNEFNSDLYLAVSGGINPPNFINYKWQVVTSVGNVFTANIVDPGTNAVKCVFSIDKTATTIPNFASIIGINQLSFDPGGVGPGSFTAVAVYYITGTVTASANIKGNSSCLNIQDCNFPPTCTANQFATDIQTLFSYLQSNSLLSSVSPVSLYTSTTTSIYLTPAIKNTLGIPNSQITYKFVSPDQYILYDATNPNVKLVFTFLTVTPAGSLPLITTFANIKSNYTDLFKMDGLNASNIKVSDIDGKAEKITPTQTIGISMGNCGLPEPPECAQKEHKVRHDLELLVNDILVTKPFTGSVDIYSYAALSPLLKSYINPSISSSTSTYTSGLTASPNFDTLVITPGNNDVKDCQILLFHYRNNGTSLNFPSIVKVSHLKGIGVPNVSGNYFTFLAIATYSIGSSTIEDTIYGRSCWPLKNCNPCPDPSEVFSAASAKRDSANVASGVAVFDPNLKAHSQYKTSVDSVNIKSSWTTTNVNYVQPLDYYTFAQKGYIASRQYVKFANNFDSLIDKKAFLVIDTFVTKYGNLTNCNIEFQRYYNSIQSYNLRVSSIVGANYLTPINDSTFYHNHLCDTVYTYIKYLKKFPASLGTNPPTILQYFGITNPYQVYTDSCKILYDYYIKAHDLFLNNIAAQSNCKGANIMHPLFSYDEIVKNNLCCSSQGINLFKSYINSLATASTNCPAALSTLSQCGPPSAFKVNPQLCHEYYITFKNKLSQYNASPYAAAHSHSLNPAIYPSFYTFQQAGYCDCVLNYINYLNSYISASPTSTLTPPVPVNIDNYPGCPHSTPTPADSCMNLYIKYLDAVNAYNGYIKNNPSLGYPFITTTFTQQEFLTKYCNCAKKFIAVLTGIINGVKPTLVDFRNGALYLPASCDIPCTNGKQDSTFVFPPYTKYDNPCVKQQINLAMENASNSYQQYIDSLTSYFADKYTRHCLGALENYTYKYTDKEYHFTLYYYDQAGNLVKTIPPEGIEPINVTSFTDILEQKIISDRTFNQQNVFTKHRMATKYIYNSLNQLIFQSLPDHDNMDICDGLGPNGLDTGLVISSVQFVTPNKGYLCGYVRSGINLKRGYIYTTNDAGNFWYKLNGVTSGDLEKVQFITASDGFAVSNFGMVFKTNDGGSSWDLLTGLYNPATGVRNVGQLKDLYFISPTFGVIGGIKNGAVSSIYYTSDGGATFNAATVTGDVTGDTITGFSFDGLTYIATSRNGNHGKLFSSSSGTVWSQVVNFSANNLRKAQFISNNLAFAVGEEGTLLALKQPISGGSPPQWELIPTNVIGNFNDVYFKNATDGVALIDSIPGNAKIWKTFNGGLTWQQLSAPGKFYNSFQLYDASQDRLIAAGKNGLLTKVLMNMPPFGVININTPSANNYSYSDAILYTPSNALRTIVVSDASPIIHTTYDSQTGAPNWLTVNTTTLSPSIPSVDASFRKVLMMDSVLANPYIKAIMVTTTGKLYSFYRGFNSATPICRPVTVPGGFAGKFFYDITSNNQSFTAPVYAIDTISKQMYVITFAGTVASAVLKTNTPAITRSIKSIDIHNSTNKLVMVGNNGHIQYTKDISLTSVTWTDVSLNMVPTAFTKIRNTGANNFIAVGIDGAVWKNSSGISNWYLRNSGTTENLNSLALDNIGNGLIAANNGKLFKLTGGNTLIPSLTLIPSPVTAHLTDVAIEPAGTSAYVTASNGKVIYMTNYNLPSPILASSSAVSPLNGVSYKAGPSALVVGNGVYIANYLSTSSMVTKNIFTGGLISTHFYDVNNGFIIDSTHVIRRTTDGGASWSVVLPDVGSNVISKIFSTKINQSVLVGKNKFASVINGNVMTPLTVPGAVHPSTHFYDVNFNANNYGVIVGASTRAVEIIPSGPTNFALTYLGQAPGIKPPDFKAVHVFANNSFIACGTRGVVGYYKSGVFYNQTNYVPAAGMTQPLITLKDIYFHDDYTGYFVGDKGNAFKVILPDVISNIGITSNSIAWKPFCAQSLYLNYTTPAQIQNLDFTSIAFSNRTNGMIAGGDKNIVISGSTPNRYARLIKDQSGYYSTRFWYDKLGRLILSQNTKQFNKKNPADATIKQAFSYSLYDQLGRIKEVGEKFENDGAGIVPKINSIFGSMVNGYFNNNIIEDVKFLTWINGVGSRREVTHTFYDAQSILPFTYTQDNLRKRVATTTFEDVYDANDLTYNHATHYTYDIHGHVTTLWQENTKVAITGQNIKQIDYQFDLISGKVNKVVYSPGQVDQFIHRYTYDADNRITKAETSKDDISFDIDAKYFYYAHGPLARTEYGKDHVQGMDYAYTLQGWIKGVNSNALKKNKDMGRDGDLSFANPNGNFARDVVGFTLDYYKGDYEAVDYLKWTTPSTRFEAFTNNSDLFNSRNDLFNGNITAMVTTISKPDTSILGQVLDPVALPLGNAYRYDQLNRIKRSSSFTNIDTATTNSWLISGTLPGLYRNTFSYDANGNIETQVKRDSVGILVDSLVYNYEKISTNKVRNRLYHVNDKVNTPLLAGDIEDQGPFSSSNINTANNYSFDEIGNLVSDKYEQIDTIKWMVTGKIKAIIRSALSTKENLYFDYDASGHRIAKHVYTSSNVWKRSTYYLRDAQGNVMSVYDKKLVGINMSYKLNEQHLYGSHRIGMFSPALEMIGSVVNNDSSKVYLGLKQYELSNHLGNVLTVISDKKAQISQLLNPFLISHYIANIISSTDYYAYGSSMYGRSFTNSPYRYGFNGKEKDDEIKGSGNSYDFGGRINDPRLGRWLSVDPLQNKYPDMSPYNYTANNPIFYVDPDGKRIRPNGKDALQATKALLKPTDAKYVALFNLYAHKIKPDGNFADNNIRDYYSLDIALPNGQTNVVNFDGFKERAEGLGLKLKDKELKAAFSTYQALLSTNDLEVEVLDPGRSAPMFGGGGKPANNYESVEDKTLNSNPNLLNLHTDIGNAGGTTEQISNDLFSTPSSPQTDKYKPTDRGDKSVYFNPGGSQSSTNDGTIIINGKGQTSQGNAKTLEKAIEKEYPQ